MDHCGPCMFRNKNTKALKFCITCREPQCKTCADIHKSSKATRNHLLLHITEMKKDSLTSHDLEMFQKCNVHPTKQAEFYCLDHSHLICTTCLLDSQTFDCGTVVDIEAAGEQLIECKFNDQTETDLENVIKHCTKEHETMLNLKKETTRERKEILKYMEDIRHKIMMAFDKCERGILDKIDKDAQSQMEVFSKKQISLRQTQKTAEENKKILLTIANNGSKSDLFRCVLSITEQLNKLQPNNDTFKSYSHVVQVSAALVTLSVGASPAMLCKTVVNPNETQHLIKLRTNKDCLHEVTKQLAFKSDSNFLTEHACSSTDAETEDVNTNSIDKHPTVSFDAIPEDVKETTPRIAVLNKSTKGNPEIHFFQESESVISTPNGKKPFIADVVTLADDCVVLSDSSWSRLIRLNGDLTYKDETGLSHTPGNMTVLNESEIAVCLPIASCISIVAVIPKFRSIRNIITKDIPKEVHALDTKRLLVSVFKRDSEKYNLQIIATDGASIRDILKSRSIKDAERISSLKLADTSPRYYLLCCKQSNALYCLEGSGKDVFTHNIISPRGVCVDSVGNVFVLGSSGSGMLHVLSKKGVLLQKLAISTDADSIAFNSKLDKLFFTRQNTAVVGVFKITR